MSKCSSKCVSARYFGNIGGGTCLEIGVRINANKVTGVSHRIVGAVHPGGPGINVTNRDARKRSAGKGILHLVDVANDGVWRGTGVLAIEDTGGRDPVQVLRADRNAGNEAVELGAVSGDGGLQGGELVGEVGIPSRAPQAKQQGGLGADGSWNGLDGRVRSAALLNWMLACPEVRHVNKTKRTHNHGVQTGRVEDTRS